jgi:hypothetical protein
MRFNKNKHQTFKKKKGGRSRSKQTGLKMKDILDQ